MVPGSDGRQWHPPPPPPPAQRPGVPHAEFFAFGFNSNRILACSNQQFFAFGFKFNRTLVWQQPAVLHLRLQLQPELGLAATSSSSPAASTGAWPSSNQQFFTVSFNFNGGLALQQPAVLHLRLQPELGVAATSSSSPLASTSTGSWRCSNQQFFTFGFNFNQSLAPQQPAVLRFRLQLQPDLGLQQPAILHLRLQLQPEFGLATTSSSSPSASTSTGAWPRSNQQFFTFGFNFNRAWCRSNQQFFTFGFNSNWSLASQQPAVLHLRRPLQPELGPVATGISSPSASTSTGV